MREEAYVVREILVLQMSFKAPYNTSFMQGQLSHDVVQYLHMWHVCHTSAFVAYFAIVLDDIMSQLALHC